MTRTIGTYRSRIDENKNNNPFKDQIKKNYKRELKFGRHPTYCHYYSIISVDLTTHLIKIENSTILFMLCLPKTWLPR